MHCIRQLKYFFIKKKSLSLFLLFYFFIQLRVNSTQIGQQLHKPNFSIRLGFALAHLLTRSLCYIPISWEKSMLHLSGMGVYTPNYLHTCHYMSGVKSLKVVIIFYRVIALLHLMRNTNLLQPVATCCHFSWPNLFVDNISWFPNNLYLFHA